MTDIQLNVLAKMYEGWRLTNDSYRAYVLYNDKTNESLIVHHRTVKSLKKKKLIKLIINNTTFYNHYNSHFILSEDPCG